MRAFWVSMMLTFWAEMGDKTQFLALAYATRYRLRDVVLGIAWGTAAVLLMSSLLGKFIASWLPAGWVETIAAISFLAFGIWTLREEKEEEQIRQATLHPIVVIGSTFFLLELGDKTMLATITLATTRAWLPVWLGSTFGMLFSDGVAVYVGKVLGKHIPDSVIKGVAATLFFGFALWSAWQAIQDFGIRIH